MTAHTSATAVLPEAAAPRGPIGVVGAGVMGAGVAQVLAQAGYSTILIDLEEGLLAQARQSIRNALRLATMLDRAKAADPDKLLDRIRCTTDLAALAEADFVIENVTEKREIKEPLYARLDAVCAPACVFAANTSVISITRLGGVTQRPDRVLGIHFMNPVAMKPTVEMIRGFHTSEHSLATAAALLQRMGKKAITVQDAPGFVSNRVLMLTVNEAAFVVAEGTADAASVDQLFRECFGHKMGPLETADLIGLDTILLSLEGLYEAYGDPKFRPCPLLRKLVDAGLLGRKSGRGFHPY
jgi:3-hydroxybutyryl-CoA dehydrogenase